VIVGQQGLKIDSDVQILGQDTSDDALTQN
jgi:membrane fusion protein (multidrug efflux system)